MPYLPPEENEDDGSNKPGSLLPNQNIGGLSPDELAAELAARGQKILSATEATTIIQRRRRRSDV